MIGIGALVLSGFILFMFGVSIASISVIAVVMLVCFLLLSTLSFLFKFGFWILIAYLIYHFFFKKEK